MRLTVERTCTTLRVASLNDVPGVSPSMQVTGFRAVDRAALAKLPVVYIYTHDSIGVGEDGPTHQDTMPAAPPPEGFEDDHLRDRRLIERAVTRRSSHARVMGILESARTEGLSEEETLQRVMEPVNG